MSLLSLALWSPQDSSQFNPLLPLEHMGSCPRPAAVTSRPLNFGLSCSRAWFPGCDTYDCGCSQLWKSGPKCTSVIWYTGVKGVVWVVLACENELHHQLMQSLLFRQGQASEFSQVATENLRGFTKEGFSRAVFILDFQASDSSLCFLSQSIISSQVIHPLAPQRFYQRIIRELAQNGNFHLENALMF